MPLIPSLSAREILIALKRAGFEQKRQNGSHVILEQIYSKKSVVVPKHNPVKRGTVHSIIQQSGLTVDEFLRLL